MMLWITALFSPFPPYIERDADRPWLLSKGGVTGCDQDFFECLR